MTKRLFIVLILLLLPVFRSAIYADSNKQPEKNQQEKENKDATEEVPFIAISVDKNKVNVGDMINLTIRYKLHQDSSFNESEIEGLEGLTIIKRKTAKGETKLTILTDKTQPFKIGPVSLTFKDKKNELNIIKSEGLDINVSSNLGSKPAEARLKPIMNIIPTYPLWLRILPYREL